MTGVVNGDMMTGEGRVVATTGATGAAVRVTGLIETATGNEIKTGSEGIATTNLDTVTVIEIEIEITRETVVDVGVKKTVTIPPMIATRGDVARKVRTKLLLITLLETVRAGALMLILVVINAPGILAILETNPMIHPDTGGTARRVAPDMKMVPNSPSRLRPR
jgi:hypothetical protein